MALQTTIDGLYRESLLAAMILLGILLINNIVLYKQKLKNSLSLMLLFAVVMCGFEILWSFCDGQPQLKALTYLGTCGYMMSFVLVGALFNRYMLSRFNRLPKSKRLTALLYLTPVGIFFLLCVTTPWTHLIVQVDKAGVLQEEILFNGLYIPLLLIYFLTAMINAIYCAFSNRSENPNSKRVAYNMIVFGIIVPGVYLLEICLLGADSSYLAVSLAISVAMVYLSTNISTNALLETRAKVEATESDLRVAAKLQSDVLPSVFPAFPERSEFDIYASMKPAKEVGGDFYDFFFTVNNKLVFLIADVSDKGIAAAMFMMKAKTVVKSLAQSGKDIDEVLCLANNILCDGNEENMFVTLWIGLFDTITGELEYANAGHSFPVIKSGADCRYLENNKFNLSLGLMENSRYDKYKTILKKGESIFLYTDGVTDANNNEEKTYGTDRLLEKLKNTDSGKSPYEICTEINDDINRFSGNATQFDDLTMLAVLYKGNKEHGL